jgi:hypothetical protein
MEGTTIARQFSVCLCLFLQTQKKRQNQLMNNAAFE